MPRLKAIVSLIVLWASTCALFAQDRQAFWTDLPNIDSYASPALAGHSDRQLYATAVAFDGLVAFSRTVRPGAWSAWQIIGPAPCAPEPCVDLSFRADVSTEPVLVRDGDTLRLFVRGDDDNLHETHKTGSAAWSPWRALTTAGDVLGRLTAARTLSNCGGAVKEFHVAYPGPNNTLVNRRFDKALNQVGAPKLWAGVEEGVIASNGSDQVCVAMRTASQRIKFETLNRPWTQSWRPSTELGPGGGGAFFDISNLAHLGGGYHLAFSVKYLCDDVGATYCHTLAHTRVRPGQPDDGFVRFFSGYTPAGDNHPLSRLAVYRDKLVLAYKDADGQVRAARWDNADPAGDWVGDKTVDAGRATRLRPALGTLDRRPALSGADWNAANFGNDLFAALHNRDTNGFAFMNFSRGVMVREIAEQFNIYNYGMPAGCPSQGQPNAPTLVANILEDGRPVYTEIGFNIWMLPHRFSKSIFRDSAEKGCRDGNATGRFNPPCAAARYPIMIKTSGPISICSGVWINSDNDYIRIWEELGHTLSGAIGFINGSVVKPTAADAARSGIALADLTVGYNIFGQDLDVIGRCKLGSDSSGRCRGFTGIASNYDATDRQHSFIYTVYYYLKDGDWLRQKVQEDLDAGVDLLARKYNWTRQHIFRGLEFGKDAEPRLLPNNRCDAATVIGEGTYRGTTKAADIDGDSSCVLNSALTPDAWFSFTAPCNGTLEVDTCCSSYDTSVSIHRECYGGPGDELACNDDCASGPCTGTLQSCASLTVVKDAVYLIRVSGYNRQIGDFTLSVRMTPACP